MRRRPEAERDRPSPHLARDLRLLFGSSPGHWEEADLALRRRPGRRTDLALVEGEAAAIQLLVQRLKTHQGELRPLGHPLYGSRHHELIGEPNLPRVRNLIKRHVLAALAREPRLAEVLECVVAPAHHPPRDQVRIELTVRFHDLIRPLSFSLDFSLESA